MVITHIEDKFKLYLNHISNSSHNRVQIRTALGNCGFDLIWVLKTEKTAKEAESKLAFKTKTCTEKSEGLELLGFLD